MLSRLGGAHGPAMHLRLGARLGAGDALGRWRARALRSVSPAWRAAGVPHDAGEILRERTEAVRHGAVRELGVTALRSAFTEHFAGGESSTSCARSIGSRMLGLVSRRTGIRSRPAPADSSTA